MKIVDRLLRKNLSATQIAGFIISNFVGMAIVIAGVQFYEDIRSLWESEDSFITTDYLVLNKKVTASNTFGEKTSEFTQSEIEDIRRQPWVRRLDGFTGLQYRVSASVNSGDHAMSTDMFLESIPSEYLDVKDVKWSYSAGDAEVPVIISKDYLTLYNFGFAGSAGLPQVSEQMMSAIPMTLRLYPVNGGVPTMIGGRIVGYSNRLNTILVPQEFMDWSNSVFGRGDKEAPKRLIVDVNSPGDVAIDQYVKDHDLEIAGDKSGSQASYLLNVVSGLIISVGIVITILSFCILLLSISLLLQKNRDKLHALIMLGYDLKSIEAPYCKLIVTSAVVSWILAVAAMFMMRVSYATRLTGVAGADLGGLWQSMLCGLLLVMITIVINIRSVKKKVKSSFRL